MSVREILGYAGCVVVPLLLSSCTTASDTSRGTDLRLSASDLPSDVRNPSLGVDFVRQPPFRPPANIGELSPGLRAAAECMVAVLRDSPNTTSVRFYAARSFMNEVYPVIDGIFRSEGRIQSAEVPFLPNRSSDGVYQYESSLPPMLTAETNAIRTRCGAEAVIPIQ
jgi:hypothetical protein